MGDPAPRSIMLIEGFVAEANFSIPTDEIFINATPNGDNIDLTRQAQGGFVLNYNWVIVEFPSSFAKVQHITHTMGGAVTSNSDTIPTALTDFTNAFPIATSRSRKVFASSRRRDLSAFPKIRNDSCDARSAKRPRDSNALPSARIMERNEAISGMAV